MRRGLGPRVRERTDSARGHRGAQQQTKRLRERARVQDLPVPAAISRETILGPPAEKHLTSI